MSEQEDQLPEVIPPRHIPEEYSDLTRPRLYGNALPRLTDPEEVRQAVEDYFEGLWKIRTITTTVDGQKQTHEEPFMFPPTMAGLGLALGLSRQSLLAYGRGDGTRDRRIVSIIAGAKARIAEFAEQALYTRDGGRGAQFALAVNHRYGREDEASTGAESFVQNIIPPAVIEGGAGRAIPVWGDDDEE